jgi:hypothetical protein
VPLQRKEIEEVSVNLLKIKDKINAGKMRELSFLMVLTGGQFAFKRNDGVLVVPIGGLKL